MRKKLGVCLIAVGAVFVAAAVLLYCLNKREDDYAGEQAQAVLSEVKVAIESQLEAEASSNETSDETSSNSEAASDISAEDMHTVTIDGYGYIGYLSVESIGLELPVMADWDQAKLKVAPCRQFGSATTDDLVIAAHNYSKHFGALTDVAVGDTVTFTDMRGVVYSYSVINSVTIQPTDVQAVRDSGYDLVLYTCNYSGAMRIALFCNYN